MGLQRLFEKISRFRRIIRRTLGAGAGHVLLYRGEYVVMVEGMALERLLKEGVEEGQEGFLT